MPWKRFPPKLSLMLWPQHSLTLGWLFARPVAHTVGVNFARLQVFREVLELGFRAPIEAVAMETGEVFSGCDRAKVYILEDCR
jgi:hypothetical protein